MHFANSDVKIANRFTEIITTISLQSLDTYIPVAKHSIEGATDRQTTLFSGTEHAPRLTSAQCT